MADTTLLY